MKRLRQKQDQFIGTLTWRLKAEFSMWDALKLRIVGFKEAPNISIKYKQIED